MVLGDKLYIKNGRIYDGKYEGISDENKVIFFVDNNPVEFDVSNILKITDDEGKTIDIGLGAETVRKNSAVEAINSILGTLTVLIGLYCVLIVILGLTGSLG